MRAGFVLDTCLSFPIIKRESESGHIISAKYFIKLLLNLMCVCARVCCAGLDYSLRKCNKCDKFKSYTRPALVTKGGQDL